MSGMILAFNAHGDDGPITGPAPHPVQAQLYEDLREKLTLEGLALIPGLLNIGLFELEFEYLAAVKDFEPGVLAAAALRPTALNVELACNVLEYLYGRFDDDRNDRPLVTTQLAFGF
ncbi:MAG: hypothetical protein ABR497_05335 [Kiritimatiellia bacterium]